MNNEIFFKVNILESSDLIDLKKYTVTGLQRPIDEPVFIHYASPDDFKYAEEWQYEQFGYQLNDYGFRCDSMPNEIELAVFGCSFTFGTGLPEHKLYHQLLSEKLNIPVYNFGLPGISIKSIVDIFLIISKHIKIKRACFLFPIYYRTQISSYDTGKDDIVHISILPNSKSRLFQSYGYDSDEVFKSVPEEEFLKSMRDSIYLLDKVAQERTVSAFYSSWDPMTYNNLCYMNLKGKILPDWISNNYEHATTDLARDRLHPGMNHHQVYADKIIEFLK